jgi:hypothetical protein
MISGSGEQKVKDMIRAGQQPSADDLRHALADVMMQRDRYEGMVRDMGSYLSRIVVAHVQADASTIVSIIDEFMAAHVVVKDSAQGKVH